VDRAAILVRRTTVGRYWRRSTGFAPPGSFRSGADPGPGPGPRGSWPFRRCHAGGPAALLRAACGLCSRTALGSRLSSTLGPRPLRCSAAPRPGRCSGRARCGWAALGPLGRSARPRCSSRPVAAAPAGGPRRCSARPLPGPAVLRPLRAVRDASAGSRPAARRAARGRLHGLSASALHHAVQARRRAAK
jgi:hypothetical protein